MPDSLLRCLRWDVEGDARLGGLDPADWDALTDTIERGAGLHLLARRLMRADVVPPPHIAQRLRNRTLAMAGRNLQARAKLAAVVRATGRPALLLKGVDLADRLYGNLGHRRMGDVDFLVRPGDVIAYHDHLIGNGFETVGVPDPARDTGGVDHHHFYRAVRREGSPKGLQPFELHWRLADARYDGALDLDGIWHRARALESFAPGARVMAPDDLFLYLCLHLKHHAFEAPLTHLWDLAELLHAPALPLDWDAIWPRAEAWQVAQAVRISLYLVEDRLGVPTQHISAWRPDRTLAALLPDPFALLGQHSQIMRFSDARLGRVLSNSATWRERGAALASGLMPSRGEMQRRYGAGGRLGGTGFYITRLAGLWTSSRQYLRDWATGEGSARDLTDRIVRLRAYLERHG